MFQGQRKSWLIEDWGLAPSLLGRVQAERQSEVGPLGVHRSDDMTRLTLRRNAPAASKIRHVDDID